MQDNQAIESEANAGTAKFVDLTPQPFVGCAKTKSAAFNALQQKAKTYNAHLLKELGNESQKRGRAFDKKAQPIPPPCNSCESCGCGSTGVPCPPDKPDCCNGECFDTQTDPSNCGACGNKCGCCEGCYQGTCGCGGPGVNCQTTGEVCCCAPGVPAEWCARACQGGGGGI